MQKSDSVTTIYVPDWLLKFATSLPRPPEYIENRMAELIKNDDFMTYERAYLIARGEYDARI